MNALLRKEVRLLLPTWTMGLLSAFSVWLIPMGPSVDSGLRNTLAAVPFLVCPALVMMMALNSFGRELGSGTFSNLLAQPISRARIWRTKTLTLALGVALIYAVWAFSFVNHLGDWVHQNPSEKLDAMVTAGVVALAAYSGGLWTVLLFRQVAAAFWFTLLAPAALLVLIEATLGGTHDDQINSVRIAVLTFYGVAGFLWARWMFLRAQDTQWTGGNIALPEWRGLARWKVGWPGSAAKRPRVALLVKEIQLHQSQLVLAGLLAVLHLGVLGGRGFRGDLREYPVLLFVLEQFWVFWLAMPLLVGSAAVAEERKLGTLEGQLCLPAKRRTQFAIKFGAVLLLSILLGAVLPLLLEGNRILPDSHFEVPSESEYAFIFATLRVSYGETVLNLLLELLALVSAWMPFLILTGISASVAMLSFYASTLARNTLQALGPAVLSVLAAEVLLAGADRPEDVITYPQWRGSLIYLIGLPLLALTLAGLMYWNYKRALVGWNVWRRNLLALLAALVLVMALTTALYHRIWERLTPLEARHGPPRLAQAKPVAEPNSYNCKLLFRLADGRAWSSHFTVSLENWLPVLTKNWKPLAVAGPNRFLEGTNWVSVAAGHWEEAGIQSDGSLWVSESPAKPRILRKTDKRPQPQPAKLVRFGDRNDWKSIGGGYGNSMFLLKTNGTLWLWGTNLCNGGQSWRGLRSFEPQRLGGDADWVEIGFSDDRAVFHKADGRAWVHSPYATSSDTDSVELAPKMYIERAPHLDQRGWRSLTSFHTRWASGSAGVHEDGTLRVNGICQGMAKSPSGQRNLAKQFVQLGQETNWLTSSATGPGETIVALKTDGSLWKWNFPDAPGARPDQAHAVRLGTHSDWLAVAPLMGGVASLAVDGSLWFWRFEPPYYYGAPDWPSHPLLAPSRRPTRLGNIFDGSN